MKDIEKKLDEWMKSEDAVCVVDTDLLYLESYEDIYLARIKHAFLAGAKIQEELINK